MSTSTYPSPSYNYPQPQHQPPQPRNGMGTAGFVLGLLAALFSTIPIVGVIGWPLSILGLVFGILGIARARKGEATNKGLAIAGTVLASIGLVLCIAWTAAFGAAAEGMNRELSQPGAPAFAPIDVPAPAAPAPAGPVEEIGEGTWRVGPDVIPGTYRTPGPDSSGLGMCYWDRAADASGEFSAIITNGVLEGPGVVTIEEGEVFTSNGCSPWTLTS